MSNVRVVFVTLPDDEAAVALTRALLEENLVACGNIVPGLRSIYRWEGEICDDPEVLVLFKTTQACFSALKSRIVELHPYDCPEVIGVDVSDGHADYLSWVREQVRA